MTPGGPLRLPCVDPVRVITDTSELRWFAPGRLPVDVLTWFSPRGGMCTAEERLDTYRLDGSTNAGLKLRSGELLELKVRQSVDAEPLALTDSLGGRLESWRRWSPADGLVDFEPTDAWGDVSKTIVKRRFVGDGVEVNAGPGSCSTDFCDAELAALNLAGVQWWSLALAAYGVPEERRRLIGVAWGALTHAASFPETSASLLGEQRGYPAWLTTKGRVPAQA